MSIETKSNEPQNIGELLAEIHRVNELAKAKGRELLGKAFAAFFERCPEVGCVVWTQYAPHFNDGDPCIFSVHEPELHADEDDDDYSYGDGCMTSADWSPATNKWNTTPEQEALIKVWNDMVYSAFGEDSLFQRVFGDDCKVVARRDGFHISACHHD